MILSLPLIMACLYRLRGSGWGPITLWRICCTLPFLLLTGLDWWALVLPLVYLAICVGHGRYYTLGRQWPTRPDNWPGKLVSLFLLNRYTYKFDFIALGITGAVVFLPVVWLAWWTVPLAFLGKPLAYTLGWRIEAFEGTEPGEWIWGFIIGFLLMVAAHGSA